MFVQECEPAFLWVVDVEESEVREHIINYTDIMRVLKLGAAS